MSNRNYTNYSKPPKKVPQPEVPIEVNEAVKETKNIAPIAPEPKKTVRGVVVGCYNLNVRTGPRKDFDVICEIPSESEVEIDESESFADFYKICTASGVEGFCMKKFIEVRK